MIAAAGKFKNVERRVGICRERVPQVGIKVGQPGAVDNEVKILLQRSRYFFALGETPLSDVSFNDFNLVSQKIRQPIAVTLEQRIEHGRLFHHLF